MSETLDWAELNPKAIAAFRANHGKIEEFYKDSSLLLLHNRGARTGKAYITPLTYRQDGDRYVVLASNVGADKNPAWFHNILAHPDVILEVGDETFPATASVPEEAERRELFSRHVAAMPRYQGYQEKTGRIIPAVVFTRTGQPPA